MKEIKQKLLDLGFRELDNLWFSKEYDVNAEFDLNLYFFQDTYGIDVWVEDENGSALKIKERVKIEWIQKFDSLFADNNQ